MVSIKTNEAERFIANPDLGVFVFLVFGTDPGLVSERVRLLVDARIDDPTHPFGLIRLHGDELAADPLRLADAANTIPLFGGKPAILIEAGSKPFTAALEMIVREPPADCMIVIAAGVLGKDAALRKLVQKSNFGAAIECYPDDANSLARLIDGEMQAAGLTITREAKEALGGLLGADRLTTRSEISKLLLYAHGSSMVTLDDVEAIVTDASALSIDAALDGAFSGDYAAIDETALRVYREGGDPSLLLGAALRHAVVLHRARLETDNGRSISEALDAVAPRLFFRRKQAMEGQLRGWTEARLARALFSLADAVGRARREARLGETIAVRALWSVALAAKHRRT